MKENCGYKEKEYTDCVWLFNGNIVLNETFQHELMTMKCC